MHQSKFMLSLLVQHMLENPGQRRRECEKVIRYAMAHKIPKWIEHLENLVELNDIDCLDNLRMPRGQLAKLCYLLKNVGGLIDSKYVSVKEKVALFLSILAHHKKIRVVRYDFKRSMQTVRKYFYEVLVAILKLHTFLLITPVPIGDDCTNPRWKSFKVTNVGHFSLIGLRYLIKIATGEHATDFVKAVNHTRNKTYIDDVQSFEDLETLNEDNECQAKNMNVSQAQSSASASAMKNTDSRLGEIAMRIGVEYDVENAKKVVYAAVNKVEGLTLHQKLFVADKLVQKTEDAYLLFSLPEVEQAEYIRMKLAVIDPIGDTNEEADDGYESYEEEEFEAEYKQLMINGLWGCTPLEEKMPQSQYDPLDFYRSMEGDFKDEMQKFVVERMENKLIPSRDVWRQFVEAHDVKLGDTLVFMHCDDMYFFIVHYDRHAGRNGQLVDGLCGVTGDENDEDIADYDEPPPHDVENRRMFRVTVPYSLGFNYHTNRLARIASMNYGLLTKDKVILRVPSEGDGEWELELKWIQRNHLPDRGLLTMARTKKFCERTRLKVGDKLMVSSDVGPWEFVVEKLDDFLIPNRGVLGELARQNNVALGDCLIFPHQSDMNFFVIMYDDEAHKSGIIDLELEYAIDDYMDDDTGDDNDSDDDVELLNMFSVTMPNSSSSTYHANCLARLCIPMMAWKKYGLLTKKKATLRVPRTRGETWDVQLKWIPRSRKEGHGSFAKKLGWFKFAQDNELLMAMLACSRLSPRTRNQ
ncbi:hypothetical protein BUALT_Bualt13G0111000 [Buddleja alternifolia]|uniref:DUF8040 domain-containing protein n=1 Tax=Buddleja alternifolia TaxID=168488 RepID=A0AAV6WVJ5_9LAMI|nr:hypothetical protein BUALT_Bualt13G0111000 [Buddleja alternifolia]